MVFVKVGQSLNDHQDHNSLGIWNKRRNGIWFRFLELQKKVNKKLQTKSMVLDACKKANFTPVRTFKTV